MFNYLKSIAFILLLLLPLSIMAQTLDQYRWNNRLVLVFAPQPTDDLLLKQLALFKNKEADFAERKIQFIFSPTTFEAGNEHLFPEGTVWADHYTQFAVNTTDFALILIGLDGSEKFRSGPTLTAPKALFDRIDQMPMRRQELSARKRKN
ncbi:MAG: DUF4174 domain-containing protein [Bacteroidota bacterium]